MDTIYFYSHCQGDYRCFSNFYDAKFISGEVEYCSTEQYMMAKKAELMGDSLILSKILSSESPSAVKRLGRQVRNFDNRLWDMHKFKIMVDGLTFKFSQNPHLNKILKDTGARRLAEASPTDRIWGIGLDFRQALSGAAWKGENLLGKALMEVRKSL